MLSSPNNQRDVVLLPNGSTVTGRTTLANGIARPGFATAESGRWRAAGNVTTKYNSTARRVGIGLRVCSARFYRLYHCLAPAESGVRGCERLGGYRYCHRWVVSRGNARIDSTVVARRTAAPRLLID